MFTPRFGITNKILSSIVEIEVAKKLISLSQLPDDWEMRLQQESSVKRVYSVLRYVGNELDIDGVAKIIKDRPERDEKVVDLAMRLSVIGKEKSLQQILNFLNADRLVSQVALLSQKLKQDTLGKKELQQINNLVGERLVVHDDLGRFRDGQSEFLVPAPLPVEILFQLEDLVTWFNSSGRKDIHPVLRAGIMLYELLRIAPFVANNLVTAMFFFQLSLITSGYSMKEIWSPEEELLKNKESFIAAVLTVENSGGDLTVWLEYVCKSLRVAAESALIRVTNLVGEKPSFRAGDGRTVTLSDRQVTIMEEVTLKTEATIKDIRQRVPMVSDDTILRDLKVLMDKKLVRKKGRTKGAVYTLGRQRSI